MDFRSKKLARNLIAASTLLAGVLTLSSSLSDFVRFHQAKEVLIDAHLTIIAGISLIYLASLLRRGKQNAWVVSIFVYVYLVLRNYQHFVFDYHDPDKYFLRTLANILIPIATLALLIIFRADFKVRSEVRRFKLVIYRALLLLSVTFIFGVAGFQLFDNRDFHEEISLPTSMHYVVDQFGLTTHDKPIAYTKRARFFVDSLAAMSASMLFYIAISFFAPVRFRLRSDRQDYADAGLISQKYSSTSEDYFKFWPHDKAYFFNQQRSAFIAYKTTRSSALVVGDPVGPKNEIKGLIVDFENYCLLNDWSTAFIHTEPTNLKNYKKLRFDAQKIGEEALVDMNNFLSSVATNKYFRHINNKFSKSAYTVEVFFPPHSQELLKNLSAISKDWLSVPGRSERGFMMGYYSDAYMQQCRIFAIKDERSNTVAFLNQINSPVSGEASYDFLRSIKDAPGNINDFLMMNFIKVLHQEGYKTLNMGLCPLKGLDEDIKHGNRALNSVLNFVYSNAGRFYSFEGLVRFKSKYEPDWEGRYIVYKGGIAGFTKASSALLRAMSKL